MAEELGTLRALARASRGADSPEDLRRETIRILGERPARLADELAALERLRADATRLEEEARRRADEATEARIRFMDNVSHELRTPLNGIMGYLDLLSEGIGGPLTESQERQIQRIRSGALRLKEMIEEILTFSKIEAGGEVFELEETDVCAATSEVGALIRPLMEDKALVFEVVLPEEPLTIRTDAGKLRQILLNLLSNAQKYTESGGVEVAVEAVDGGARVLVRDTGPGIESGDHEKIFAAFQRLQTAGGRSGTGLGLSVSRSLATMLGGDLTVESVPGEGSTFALVLPSAPSDPGGDASGEPLSVQAAVAALDPGSDLPTVPGGEKLSGTPPPEPPAPAAPA